MNRPPISEDNLDRMARALMERHKVNYEGALEILGRMRLRVVCDATIAGSAARQAALLTILNTGRRAFHGGVYVTMPQNIPCLLPWGSPGSLNDVVGMMGGRFADPGLCPYTQTIYLATSGDFDPDALSVFCSGWRGGIAPSGVDVAMSDASDFATGGILAGALAVAAGFLRISGISSRPLAEPYGISLWRPDLHWLSPIADGPRLESLPKALWILGLGHLGQAYLWNLALLPYLEPSEASFLLQDFDSVVSGNFSSQLLCEYSNIGRKKTRVCTDWLEARGFSTVITERQFDDTTRRVDLEPYVALCGFDKAKPRRSLENAGFDLIVECALGGELSKFDRIVLHTFPDGRRRPMDIWATDDEPRPDREIVEALRSEGDCGILAETLAKKAISSAFVGAVAGALVTGEVLRAFNSGARCDFIQTQLRYNAQPSVVVKDEKYACRVARSGYCQVSI